jgi:hypothetical protein
LKEIMSLAHWMAIATLVAAPAAVAAQENTRPMDPSNQDAKSTSFAYESVLSGYRSMPEEDNASDNVWRSANDEMAGLGGHAGHLKGASGAASPSPQAESPQVAPKANTMPSGHAGHGMDQKSKGK